MKNLFILYECRNKVKTIFIFPRYKRLKQHNLKLVGPDQEKEGYFTSPPTVCVCVPCAWWKEKVVYLSGKNEG